LGHQIFGDTLTLTRVDENKLHPPMMPSIKTPYLNEKYRKLGINFFDAKYCLAEYLVLNVCSMI
jgi:hypothetical protein